MPSPSKPSVPLNPISSHPDSRRSMSNASSLSSSGSSTPIVKTTSPLNPAAYSSPALKSFPLPAVNEDRYASSEPSHSPSGSPVPPSRRVRGLSISTVRGGSPSPSLAPSISRVSSAPDGAPRGRTTSVTRRGIGTPVSHRSQSPFRDLALTWRGVSRIGGNETPPNGESTTWWNYKEPVARPWYEKRQKTIPQEQTEGWARTRRKVARAAVNILGTAAEVGHEALLLTVDLLEFAPIVGLEPAARTLLSIWDALQQVDMNRMACLRLTERCATMLMSIREEIAEAGDDVRDELLTPIQRLQEAYDQVLYFLQKQSHRPFLKRYLKRDELHVQIQMCDASLTDALGMFNVSIQIRMLRMVKAEEHAHSELLAHIAREHAQISPQNSLLLTGVEPASEHPELPPDPLREFSALQALQNQEDFARDTADLRQLMRNALQTNNDMEMIKVLQVGRDEMPEAIKTLQRALETEIEKEGSLNEVAVTEENAMTVTVLGSEISPIKPRVKVAEGETTSGEIPVVSRTNTVRSIASIGSSTHTTITTATASSRTPSRDTLHREFLESGIESLRRLSRGTGTDLSLPSWTITRYEIDRDEKIGIGFFSDVYKGRWFSRTVAIKVLADTTPREMFIHEVNVWKRLIHPNVLELLGASSTTSDPPWFLVSPYMKNGSLVRYLKGLKSLDEVNILKMIHEVAKGMAYLHQQGVLHGDLKAANILVNDKGHCVITDFGQSEMKSEAYRLSGTPLPHGTLRWQAPEVMAGQSDLTRAVDIYAFAICCVEMLTKGQVPWHMADDNSVRHFVLTENMRPEIPLGRVWSSQLAAIIQSCWQANPDSRPSFDVIDGEVQKLRASYGADLKESPQPPPQHLAEHSSRKSPSMRPLTSLPMLPPDTTAVVYDSSESPSIDSRLAVTKITQLTIPEPDEIFHRDSQADGEDASNTKMPHSRASTMLISSESEYEHQLEYSGYESPPPADERVAAARDERRYRMLLQHEFHPSLTLPLWQPCFVSLGAVGYHRKPDGDFVTLFNSFKPLESSQGVAKDLPSLYGYGRVGMGSQRMDKRNVAQRGFDIIQSWLSSRSKGDGRFSQHVCRRYSSPLRNGHKTAHLFTESTTYRYVEDLKTPKAWFKANVEHILHLYGAEHDIQKEDLLLGKFALSSPSYAQ
ncbi:Serine/threonine-protein kinase [Abortiporus biennis]